MAQQRRLGLVEDLAQSFEAKAGVQSVYGQPIEREGLTVIPVAKIRYGLGGGAGSSKEEGEGSGGGGGMVASPVGYIEIKEGASRFKRINLSAFILQITGGVAVGAWLILHGVKALQKKHIPNPR